MEFGNILVMAMMIGLFIFCIVGGSYYLSYQNGASVTIINKTSMSKIYGNLSQSLNTSSSEAETQRQNLASETGHPILSTLGFAFQSILTAGMTFMQRIVDTTNIVLILAKEAFMINPIVTGTIMATILGVLILGVWSLWRAGR